MQKYSIKHVILAISLIIGIIVVGVAGLMIIEDLSLIDAFWLTMATVATVGYGDIIPKTPEGKVFVILLILGGVGIFAYALGVIVSITIEGQLKNVMGRKAMQKKILNLQEHIILCGAGRVGQEIAERLTEEKRSFVIVEKDESLFEPLTAKGYLVIQGDATNDEVLEKANISKASGLIACLEGDANNVFVTLTARGLNPDLQIVARASRVESEAKLKRAGANKVISPAIIGGRRMAISMLKPTSVEFLDTVLHTKNVEIELEEFFISPNFPLTNNTLTGLNIRKKTGANVIAVKRDETVIPNPGGDQDLLPGDLIISLGTREQLRALEKILLML